MRKYTELRAEPWTVILAVAVAALFAFMFMRMGGRPTDPQAMMAQMMGQGIQGMMQPSLQSKIDCAIPWLEKAITLHELHMKDPTTTTEQSQMELMDQIKKAYECLTGKSGMKH